MIILLPDRRLHILLKSVRSNANTRAFVSLCLPFHALCLVNIFEIDFVFTSFGLSPGKPFARLLTHLRASVVWIYYPLPSLNIWGTFSFPFSPPLPSLASPPLHSHPVVFTPLQTIVCLFPVTSFSSVILLFLPSLSLCFASTRNT